jgi:hypothetical protein
MILANSTANGSGLSKSAASRRFVALSAIRKDKTGVQGKERVEFNLDSLHDQLACPSAEAQRVKIEFVHTLHGDDSRVRCPLRHDLDGLALLFRDSERQARAVPISNDCKCRDPWEYLPPVFAGVPEQGGGSLIPDGPLNPGVMHTVVGISVCTAWKRR